MVERKIYFDGTDNVTEKLLIDVTLLKNPDFNIKCFVDDNWDKWVTNFSIENKDYIYMNEFTKNEIIEILTIIQETWNLK